MIHIFNTKDNIPVRALFLGERLDLKAFETTNRLASSPLLVSTGAQGCAVLFRYGAVVLFNITAVEEVAFLNQIRPLISEPFERPETEDNELRLDPEGNLRVENGVITLQSYSYERLQIVAEVLARSVVLSYYEHSVAATFDSIEPLAEDLRHGHVGKHKELTARIGSMLLIHHKTVGRVEVTEKPDLLWEHPELERLYSKLVDEYELHERHLALERKLQLIFNTVETVMDLLHTNRLIQLEWYVVALILIEIFISLYEIVTKH
ncbi:MAG: RMD1 family protein [Acidobacteriota bacterium]|nr:RMD1 family protein [Blastocatellia bacterium]MDW8411426.1 RMD1 family protein [Acidobacteriota bacterium]